MHAVRAACSLGAQRVRAAHNGSAQSGVLWLREVLDMLWFAGDYWEDSSLFSSCLLLALLWASISPAGAMA